MILMWAVKPPKFRDEHVAFRSLNDSEEHRKRDPTLITGVYELFIAGKHLAKT